MRKFKIEVVGYGEGAARRVGWGVFEFEHIVNADTAVCILPYGMGGFEEAVKVARQLKKLSRHGDREVDAMIALLKATRMTHGD